MTDARTYAVPGRARTPHIDSRTSGRKRWAAGAVATATAVGTLGVFAPPALAAVSDGRSIEVFYGRDFVGVNGYPPNTDVRVEVHRGTELIGFAEYPTDDTGFLEINHTGEGDCWESPYTPDIEPGDKVSAFVDGQLNPDFTMTRDVYIDDAATVFDVTAKTITVNGHVRSTPEAPIAAGDVRELRINLNNGTWSTTGRKDLRADVGADVDPATGNFTHTFTGLTEADVRNAQAGSEMAIEWSEAGEAEPIPELTIFDGEAQPFGSCPPALPDDRVAPTQVTGVFSTQPSFGTVEIDWTAATDDVGVTGYVVTRTHLDSGTVAVYQAGEALYYSQTRVPTGRYSYAVHAVDAAGNAGQKSAEVLVGVGVDAPPAAPTGLTATASGSSIALNWSAPAAGTSAVSYQVLRGTTVVAETVTGTTYTDANRPVGTHTYTVKSRSADGTLSSASEPASAEVLTPPDTTAPSAVTLSGSVTGSTANLSWTAATDAVGVTGYRVFRDGVQVGTDLPETARTYGDAGLVDGTYDYTVKALDAAGNVSTSNTRTLTVDTQAPTASTLTGSLNGSTATLNWTAATDTVGVTAYQVFRNGTQVGANLASTARSVSHANLAPGTYAYTVRALDAAGNASTSNTVSLTVAANAAPTVTARTPAVSATNVAVTTNVTATFSEPVVGVSASTVFLRAPGSTTNIPAAVSYDAATRVATLNPNANLANSTQYTVTLDGGATQIRDSANLALADTTWTFTTAAAANPAPTVTGRAPAVNAVSVPVANNITATFSEAVQGVGTGTFRVTNPAGTAVAATVTRNGTTNQWILNPGANLANDTRYTVTLTGGATAIRDLQGAALATTSWSFTTGPAPTVTARTPAVNGTGVGRAANITATFSEAVQSVGTATFYLRTATGTTNIAATVTRNGTTNQWILNPGATLAANTQYRVTLDGGPAAIRDSAGNPLTDVSWTFTTGAA